MLTTHNDCLLFLIKYALFLPSLHHRYNSTIFLINTFVQEVLIYFRQGSYKEENLHKDYYLLRLLVIVLLREF